MNQEWVTVSAVEADGIWVESMQRSACDSCNAKAGCGQRTLSQLGKPLRLWLTTDEPFKVGERVQVELPTGGLALSALILYAVPLLGLVLSALLGQNYVSEGWAVLLGVLGLVVGLLISRQLSFKYQFLWQPQILPQCISTISLDK